MRVELSPALATPLPICVLVCGHVTIIRPADSPLAHTRAARPFRLGHALATFWLATFLTLPLTTTLLTATDRGASLRAALYIRTIWADHIQAIDGFVCAALLATLHKTAQDQRLIARRRCFRLVALVRPAVTATAFGRPPPRRMATAVSGLIVPVIGTGGLVEETLVVAARLGRRLASGRRMRPLLVDITSATPIPKACAAAPQAIVVEGPAVEGVCRPSDAEAGPLRQVINDTEKPLVVGEIAEAATATRRTGERPTAAVVVASPALGAVALIAPEVATVWHPAAPVELCRQTTFMPLAPTVSAPRRIRLAVLDVGVHPYVVGATSVISSLPWIRH